MNDAEFRRRAHALLKHALVIEDGYGTKRSEEHRALLAAGADRKTCNCAYPPAHAPDCPDRGPLWPTPSPSRAIPQKWKP